MECIYRFIKYKLYSENIISIINRKLFYNFIIKNTAFYVRY